MRRSALIVLLAAALLAAPALARAEDLPKFGEYTYVEEPPEVVQSVEPVYPDIAREAGVTGTVMVQALVSREGLVVDTRITRSIPMLDQAAIEAVRQWRFKPAMSNGQPVAVWVAVPVKFYADQYGGEIPPPAAGRISPEDLRNLPVQPAWKLSAGRYAIDGDSSDVVLVNEIAGDRVRLESPGEWEGAGVLRGTEYWGVFVYGDAAREPKNRGARGTHLGHLQSDGRVAIEGTFTNRPWGRFTSTWVPMPLHFRGTQRVTPEALRLQIDGRDVPDTARGHRITFVTPGPPRTPSTELRHPVWPPESGAPAQRYEHPLWPPEWSQGDDRVVLAEDMSADTPPQVSRRVEPVPPRESARGSGGDDLVVVKALVLRDGSVGDARIAESVPGLDDAALAAVRQWHFRPALWHGRPIALWVYVPVRSERR